MSIFEKAFDWFDQQAKEGKELTINWEGGNDEGWCHFEIDGETCQNEHTELVIDKMYDELDYGSWAGNFYAAGEAIYDPKTKEFEGVDECGTEETYSWTCDPVIIRVPKKFPFDVVDIQTESEDCDTSITLEGLTRFQHPEELKYFESIEKSVSDNIIKSIFKQVGKEKDPAGYWFNYRIAKAEMIEDGDFLVGKLHELSAQVSEDEDRNMNINLKELLENE